MRFVEFCKRVGVVLTPGQMALARVCFDGEEPEAVGGAEARELFGGVGKYDGMARRVVTVVAGARSGKTYLSALRALHLAIVTPLVRLAPGEEAFVMLIGPSKSHAQQILRYARGAASLVPAIESSIVASSPDHFTLERRTAVGGGKVVAQRVNILCVAATAGGQSARGKTLLGAFLDEAAFFRDENYTVNDRDMFDAATVRVIKGGQTIVASTPWAESGLLFERHKDHFGKPKAVVAHASTTTMRRGGPEWDAIEWEIAQARASDPENAAREYDAEFLAGGAGLYFDPQAVDMAVRPADVILDPAHGTQITAGADFGFKHDSSALVICQRGGGHTHVSRVVEVRPEKGRPLSPSIVVEQFANHLKHFGLKAVMADAHYREAIAEHLQKHGISVMPAPEGQAGKTAVYARAKQLVHDAAIVLPQHDRMVRQLKEIVAKPTAGGGISIQSPRWKAGGHGDIVSALVLALYQLHGHSTEEKKVLSWGTKLMMDRHKEALRQRRAAERAGLASTLRHYQQQTRFN